jgi:hypothetical protein
MNAEFRNHEQNKRFHAMIRDIADQVEWAGEKMDVPEWKLLILAGAYGQKVVPNPIGEGFIIKNNRRSSGLYKPEMADLITQLLAFGNSKGVEWRDPEWQAYLREIGEEKEKISEAA